MASEIVLAGSSPVPSVAASPAPVAARSSAARSSSAPAAKAVSHEVAVAQVNQHLQQVQPELKLQVDAGSGRTVFQLVQQGTGEVLLQVPSAEVLGMSRRLRESESQAGASGTLLDKQG
jgi:uncharacterized FlaG/YvyC family protein